MMLTDVDLPVVVRAHDCWSGVPKNSHLCPVVVDGAICPVHAEPQVVSVFDLRTVCKFTGGFSDISIDYCQVHPALVTVGAAGVHRKRVLALFGEDDRYPEGQKKDANVCKHRVKPFTGER